MRRLFPLKGMLVLAAVMLVIGLAVPVSADFIDLPVKWSQPITVGGLPVYGPGLAPGIIDLVDIVSDHTVGIVRADDFTSDGRPIIAVRWWGSYIGVSQPRPDGFTGPFDISFHLSTGPPHPFSLPLDEPLVIFTVSAQEVFVGFDIAGHAVYRYDAFLPEPFHEHEGVEYFIDIDKPTNEGWGWHMTTLQIQDFSAVAPSHSGPWSSEHFDLAFELITIPEPGSALLVLFGCVALLIVNRRSGLHS